MEIYSKEAPHILLHKINRLSDIAEQRKDLSDVKQFIQVATLRHDKGKTFYPHYHIVRDCSPQSIAQETWIVIKGSVKCFYYDTDNTLIATEIINAGDCSITYYGGHNYEFLEDDCIVYEVKAGQYFGVDKDKKAI
jgi:uncharacterized protein YbcV (DUF1398 family)